MRTYSRRYATRRTWFQRLTVWAANGNRVGEEVPEAGRPSAPPLRLGAPGSDPGPCCIDSEASSNP